VRLALEMLTDDWDSVVSVVPVPEHYSPDLAARIVDGRYFPMLSAPPTRRQDCCPAYVRDGTVYVIRRDVIEGGSLYGRDCRAMIVPFDESCTLDTEDDWRRAEQMTKAVA
jgi:CMP-N-acetylneuraminic acid synthetase